MNEYIKTFFLNNKKYLFIAKKTYSIILIILIEYLSEMFLKKKIIKFIEILPKISLQKHTFPNSFFSKRNKDIIYFLIIRF